MGSARTTSSQFMQRARMREDAAKKEEQGEEVNEAHWIVPQDGSQRKCIVIMEGDPKPGALLGRMSFKNFNPAVDKLAEDAETIIKRKFNKAQTESGSGSGDAKEAEVRKKMKIESHGSSDTKAQVDLRSPKHVGNTKVERHDKEQRGR